MKHRISRILPLVALLVLLGGCAAPARLAQVQRQVAAAASAAQRAAAEAATETATSSTAGGSTARPAAVTTTTTATEAATTRVAATAPAAIITAVKKVIEQANAEQQAAFSKHDATLMQDTATAAYYQELVQTNRDMANGGVSSIKLLQLRWGSISQRDGTHVQATTFETWQTVLNNGAVDQSTDRNVYTLVLQGGTWKIAADVHPDSQLDNPGGNPAGQPGALPAPSSRPAPLSIGESHNWSGYAATGGTYTAVSATWKVPQVAADRAGSDATWVGIGGVTSHDLIQAGTEAMVSYAGNVQYEAWIELLPRASHSVPLIVSPGDSVTVSLTQQSSGEWAIAFQNNTTGKSYQTTEQYDSSLSSAEWVEEAPSGGRRVLPLDQFGSVQFTAGAAVKNGTRETIAKAGGRPITLIGPYGEAAARPSALGADGASFTVTRLTTSTPTQPVPGSAPNQLLPGGGYGRGQVTPWPAAWQARAR